MHFSLYHAFPEIVILGQNFKGLMGDYTTERDATTCVYVWLQTEYQEDERKYEWSRVMPERGFQQ